ncbi:hypothetical protein LINPERHAP1_LOCUS36675 [Linum perenne]
MGSFTKAPNTLFQSPGGYSYWELYREDC